ncbi:hypothetical protein NDU88_000269 [Pleurodeles waltl]|uniref:Uncharacterized protein n=1 Tax=Pleurodeles waltl TaxID=8319 RepID=A0AAV7UQL0_PLEWA|nr:hypothetical protein NDU88_000269 [Pleurodeles waltl]
MVMGHVTGWRLRDPEDHPPGEGEKKKKPLLKGCQCCYKKRMSYDLCAATVLLRCAARAWNVERGEIASVGMQRKEAVGSELPRR